MAWTTPGTAVAGNVLTAALWNSDVRDNSLMGNPVFTNEAARDAAITSPVEGQRVYLTTPTVPAATGASTAVPTGVTTIYNGSVWVCVTPVGAFSNTSATTTSASYVSTLTGDSTAIAVTLVTGTSARIDLSGVIANSGIATTYISYAVSGATTISASDGIGSGATVSAATYIVTPSRSQIITGLTAGTNTFTLNYKTTAGTSTYTARNLIVMGIA
jgi:hypothetical protein